MNVARFPATRLPIFDCENEVHPIVDRLAILEMALDTAGPLTAEHARAVNRLVGEALTEATKVQTAWDASYGDQA